MIVLLDRPFPETSLAQSAELDLRNIGPKVWPQVLAHCRAQKLRLYHLTLASLQGLERLVDTRELELEWATKIDDMTPLWQLTRLQSLSIVDVPRLHELAGIEALQQLTRLHLSGSQGASGNPMRLVSLEPLVGLPGLSELSLVNARIDDDDIRVLARCTGLRRLKLSNQFERAQMAFVAGRLNSQLAEPLTACIETRVPCKKCAAPTSLFSGRRMPFLCPDCDRKRFEKLTGEFDQLVREAQG